MKKVFSLIFAVAALLCLGCGCAATSREATPRQHTVELQSNPTTGHTWTYKASKEGIVKEISAEYIERETAEGLVGAGGTSKWVFESVAPGTVVLSFVCSQSGDEAAEPANAVDITLVVDKDLSIDETAIEWIDGTVG